MLIVTETLMIPLSELRFVFSRSSGPGGQNVNKVASRATLRWSVVDSPSLPPDVRGRLTARYPNRITRGGELVMHSDRYRDQGRNVADCLEKLRAMLLEVARPPKRRRATRPTAGSRQRRLASKQRQAEKKQRRGTLPGDA